MARVSAQRLRMGGPEQHEKKPQGSELEGQWENQCEGILGTTEAPCIPLHERKQALESQRCQVSGLSISTSQTVLQMQR